MNYFLPIAIFIVASVSFAQPAPKRPHESSAAAAAFIDEDNETKVDEDAHDDLYPLQGAPPLDAIDNRPRVDDAQRELPRTRDLYPAMFAFAEHLPRMAAWLTTVMTARAHASPHQKVWDAAKGGRWEEVRNAISSDPSAIDYAPTEGPGRGASALCIAALTRQWDLVRTMLQNHPAANIDAAPLEGRGRGMSVLWLAAASKQWDLVRAMLQNYPAANIDAAPLEGAIRGVSVLCIAAANKQWDIVRTMLQNNPTANIDSAPLEGPDRGKSALWFAAGHNQWDLVRDMLQNYPTANIYAAPLEGPNRGETVLWFAAAHQQWDLVRTMLQNNPAANMDAAALEGPERGKSVLWFAARNKQWDLVRAMLQNNPTANIDATALEGPFRGTSVLWFAAAERQWDLVRTMLQNNPTANIHAAPVEGPYRGKTILRWAATHQQWDLITLMLQGDPNVLVKRAQAIISLGATTPSVEHSALATLLVHADNFWEDTNLLAPLRQMREAIQSVAQNCLRSWASQDDSLLTHSLFPTDIQNLIALHTMRTHTCLESVPNHLLMPLLQAQSQKHNREWLARQTARQAFETRFPFTQPAGTLDAPYSAANIEATAQVIMATLRESLQLNALTRVEAEAFARTAATQLAGLNEFTPQNIKTAVQNTKKRSSEEEYPPAKRQICEQIKEPLKSRQGTRRSGERASFEEQEIAQDADVSDPVLRALGLNRAAAIELILDAADEGAIRTLVATEIQRAALAHQLPSLMQAPIGLSAEAFFEWAMRRDTFENYVAAVLGHQEGRIGYRLATAGLLGALAQLTHTHLTIWQPEADSHEVYPAYEAGGQGHRRIDLLHTNDMTEFTLLTPEQAIVPMAVETMPIVRVATPTMPLSRSAALPPAPPLSGAASGQMRSPL